MPLTAEPMTKTVEIRGIRFKIRELTIGEYDELEKKATTKRPNPVNPDGPEFEVTDRSQLLRLMVLKCVVEPRLTPSKLADLPMPNIDRVITWAQEVLGKEYLVDGQLRGSSVAASRAPQRYGFRTLEQLLSKT